MRCTCGDTLLFFKTEGVEESTSASFFHFTAQSSKTSPEDFNGRLHCSYVEEYREAIFRGLILALLKGYQPAKMSFGDSVQCREKMSQTVDSCS